MNRRRTRGGEWRGGERGEGIGGREGGGGGGRGREGGGEGGEGGYILKSYLLRKY